MNLTAILVGMTSAFTVQFLVSTSDKVSPWLLKAQHLFPGRVVALTSSIVWTVVDEIAKIHFNRHGILSNNPTCRVLASALIATTVVMSVVGVISLVTPLTGILSCAAYGIVSIIFFKVIFTSLTSRSRNPLRPTPKTVEKEIRTPEETTTKLSGMKNKEKVDYLDINYCTLKYRCLELYNRSVSKPEGIKMGEQQHNSKPCK